jgi:sulfur-oxidizing protein SoxY
MQQRSDSSRRQFLGLAGGAAVLGALPTVIVRPAEATPATMAAAIQRVTGGAPVRTGKVKLDIPPLVENGNTVPMTVTVAHPMAPEDHVRSIHVFNEKNPQPNIGNFHLGPQNDPHPARRQPEDHRDRQTVGRLVLVGQRRRRGDARRLHRGADLMAAALINVPPKAKRGDIIEIKTLMSHIMETGYRHTASGEIVPRNIITSFTCRFNGTEIFRADMFPATAANPFITFFATATESGKFEFEWIGDQGFSERASASITVE